MVIMDVAYETLRCIVGPNIEFLGEGRTLILVGENRL